MPPPPDAVSLTSNRPRWIGGLLVIFLLAGCGGQSQRTDPADCPDDEAKASLFVIMQDLYLWNDETVQKEKYRQTNLASFETDRDLLDHIRWLPEDRSFTHITSKVAEDQQNAGIAAGYGFSGTRRPESSEIFIREAIEGGPVHAAGVRRGWSLAEVGGRTIEELDQEGSLAASLGYPDLEVGTTRELRFRDREGKLREPASITVTEFDVDPVPIIEILDRDNIGYVLLRSFVPPAVARIESAVKQLRQAGVRRIVLDLRYNLGGSLDVAEAIGGMLGGAAVRGERMYRLAFNEANERRNLTGNFRASYNGDNLASGDFDDILFITTSSTASASELLIHSLRPYNDQIGVTSVGQRTLGKPVGQVAQDYCGQAKRLRIVSFRVENSLGETGYFSGLPPDCAASDELGRDLGDPSEASLEAALHNFQTGECLLESRERTTSVDRWRAMPLEINHRFDGIL